MTSSMKNTHVYKNLFNTVKLAHAVTSIKQPLVLKGHIFLDPS